MEDSQRPNAKEDAFSEAVVLDLSEVLQALPEEDVPIIELTDRIEPTLAGVDDTVIDLGEPLADVDDTVIDLSEPIDLVQEAPHAAGPLEDGGLAASDSALADVSIAVDGNGAAQELAIEDEFREDSEASDNDFADSLGIEIPAGSGSDDIPVELPAAGFVDLSQEDRVSGRGVAASEASALTPEQIESALERVIEKIYAEKIEGILVETIERVVSRELERIKSVLAGDSGADDQR